MMMMKKTFYYNFLPTKAQEEAAEARNVPLQVSRVLIEVNNIHLPSLHMHESNLSNPWPIRKILVSREIMSEKIELTYNDTFDHIFRYWTLDMANVVVMGGSAFQSLG
ncbi:hypothetical protein CRG98_015714 [Punica granatum]|uniref:Uncharacterized protein n=1 Tax=Punica granatum TaxID=22663 RepID=A0A2I0K5Q2_PUNGR|nr:hypothetical protein CRG98_015714 [Punica granatum]